VRGGSGPQGGHTRIGPFAGAFGSPFGKAGRGVKKRPNFFFFIFFFFFFCHFRGQKGGGPPQAPFGFFPNGSAKKWLGFFGVFARGGGANHPRAHVSFAIGGGTNGGEKFGGNPFFFVVFQQPFWGHIGIF